MLDHASSVTVTINISIVSSSFVQICITFPALQSSYSPCAVPVLYATYLKNRSPTRVLDGKTPDEVFWGKKPDVSHLQEFGAKIWVLRQDGQTHKLQEKSRQFIFTGFSENS